MILHPSLRAGALVDERYRVERLIALGGSSSVYAATDVRLGRTVVLKAAAPTPEAGATLEREAVLLGGLSHPHIARLLDVVPGDGAVLVLEYAGRCLEQLVRAGAPPPHSLVSRWASDLSSALTYLHQWGALHLDVKPANVLVDADGHAVLIDFGSARLIADAHEPLREGTPRYTAPAFVGGAPAGTQADHLALRLTMAFATGSRATRAG